ncbi:ABC transporter transmembrane protein [Sphingobacterium allocomposti]|uniref:ABC transporter transmembrane protein n=1 Tax=Sphingobacterium allocomposti TaxID=415956 RepID=A0A5S5DLN9_9SPHI|nr:ABC transporter transmembrane domain-containing protein [Sphingobacterium composti Yoo et al. 2007 non Ten et al. 2007]TYP96564.1 ABC transporter transmembrane protein [Sphingobacterium composti Yoo et al. 2007 non Ten et al. 2007]
MTHKEGGPTPFQRLVKLFHPERRTINYIFIYAMVIGVFSLSIPVGITAIFNLLNNGAMYSSTYILIAFVLFGIVVAGFLLIGQLSLVEYLEQKIFLKTAVEFAYRLPRIKPAELEGENLVELVNRFFDVIIIQKGIIKLLMDIMTAVVTIFFSVVLLSFYHPVFLSFGLVVIASVIILLVVYYRRGVDSSVLESQQKYEAVAYLESVAANIEAYRGNPEKMQEVVAKTDHITSKYLTFRNLHFKVLKRFFTGSMIIRTLLFGAMLLLGSYFVVERQMTFGQFVAAEVVIVQIGYAIEKLLTNLSTIFDMLTGAVKLGAVTDLALEEGVADYGE